VFISGPRAGSAYKAGTSATSRISSGARGLIPKSYGGKAAAVGALGIAAGIATYRHAKASGNPRGLGGTMGVGMMGAGAAAMMAGPMGLRRPPIL